MAFRIQVRRGTSAEWVDANPVLADGEIGFERDTGFFKIGNGTLDWLSLGYAGGAEDVVNSIEGRTGEVTLNDLYEPIGSADAAASAAVAALVDSSPETLNTLNELAAALGDDPNFATTVTNLIATKQPLDTDLSAIADLTTTTYGRSLLTLADAVAARTSIGTYSTAQTDAAIAAATLITAVTESTTARTLELTDAAKVVECTNAAATTVTVPPNSSVAFPIGSVVNVYAAGAGGVTIAAGAGVTIRNMGPVLQYNEASLRKRATDEWVQVG